MRKPMGFWATFLATLKTAIFNRDTLVITVVATAFYLIFYAWPYANQQIEHIPVMVLDQDQSASSRRFIQAFEASPAVDLVAVLHNEGEAMDAYRRDRVSIVVTIPQHFEADLAAGENTTVHLLSNGAFPVKGRAVQAALTGAVMDGERALSEASLLLAGTPNVVFETQTRLMGDGTTVLYRFNEIGGYGNYTVPIVGPVILQAVMFMMITMTLGGLLTKANPPALLMPALQWPVRLGSAMALAFWGIAYAWFLYMQGFDFWFNEYGSLATPAMTLLAGAIYCADLVAMAMAITLAMGSNRWTTQAVVMISAPAVFISGGIWPAENMWTWPVIALSHLLPSTPGIHAIVALSQDGAEWMDVTGNLLELALQATVYSAIGIWLAIHHDRQKTSGTFSVDDIH